MTKLTTGAGIACDNPAPYSSWSISEANYYFNGATDCTVDQTIAVVE